MQLVRRVVDDWPITFEDWTRANVTAGAMLDLLVQIRLADSQRTRVRARRGDPLRRRVRV